MSYRFVLHVHVYTCACRVVERNNRVVVEWSC